MNVYSAWAETNFSTQWCYENFVQVGERGWSTQSAWGQAVRLD